MLIAFHRGDSEWVEAARLAGLERALLALGLSDTAAWDLNFEDDIGRAMLGYGDPIATFPSSVGLSEEPLNSSKQTTAEMADYIQTRLTTAV